jgi:hypothetical protein
MAKSDPIERALDRLGELRHKYSANPAVEELRQFLRNRSNLVVAKAARIVREQNVRVLIPDLLLAYEKLMADAPRLDKRCAAITEIVTALYELDFDEPAPYLRCLRHVQLEASFGPPVDSAAKLRGLSAQGLLRTRHADALHHVLPLLLDREPQARVGAIRAFATNGGEAGLLLLKLKVLCGDQELEVLGECFAGLLASSPEKSIGFVGQYIEAEDTAVAEAAILALGESRHASALEILKEKWKRSVTGPTRKVLLAALAASRLDEAVDFLISVAGESSTPTAMDAIEALSAFRSNERVRTSLSEAVSQRNEDAIMRAFRLHFPA